ncbi:MAG: QueT transporter family protein [Clostridia bacterium]|nr:QueT transporter family protein [Clostridia bacterium]
MSKFSTKVRYLSHAAMIGALYVALTFISAAAGLSSGAIQIRLSEALTVLPAFTPAAIPGLAVGCLLANTLTGGLPWDVVFGTLATLIGALGTYALRRAPHWLAPTPPILANVLIVPAVLQLVYGDPHAYPFLMLTVGVGEVIAAGIFGMSLYHAVKKIRIFER